MSVATFVERPGGLEAVNYGKDDSAARALLTQRGLPPERVADAKLPVDADSIFVESTGPQVTAAERTAVEEALRVWYGEWSVIARAAINDRRTLRALGAREGKSREAKLHDEAQEPATQAPALPASTPALALTNGVALRDA